MSRTTLVAVALLLSPATLEWTGYGQGGVMQHLNNPEGCNDNSSPLTFTGGGGAIEYRNTEVDGWHNGVSLRASGDLRIGDLQEFDSTRRLGIFRANLTVGWESDYVGIRGGLYLSNGNYDEDEMVLPAMSLRVGNPSVFFRVSMLDQPTCFIAECIIGADLTTKYISFGASRGVTSGRLFASGRIPDVLGSVDLTLGAAYIVSGGGSRGGDSVTGFIGLTDRFEINKPIQTRIVRRPSD